MLRRLLTLLGVVTLILDADLSASVVSPAAQAVLGYAPTRCSVKPYSLTSTRTTSRCFQLVAGLRHDDDQDIELRTTHSDGRTLVMEGVLTNLLAHPSVSGFVLTVRDVTERHSIEKRLIHQAFHDGLTGLANRELFADRLGHALAPRHEVAEPVVVLFCDLDDVKEVNDRLGDAAGDEVLTIVGKRLDAVVDGFDPAARPGGDEFAVLTLDATVATGQRMAEQIRTELAWPVEVAGATLQL